MPWTSNSLGFSTQHMYRRLGSISSSKMASWERKRMPQGRLLPQFYVQDSHFIPHMVYIRNWMIWWWTRHGKMVLWTSGCWDMHSAPVSCVIFPAYTVNSLVVFIYFWYLLSLSLLSLTISRVVPILIRLQGYSLRIMFTCFCSHPCFYMPHCFIQVWHAFGFPVYGLLYITSYHS